MPPPRSTLISSLTSRLTATTSLLLERSRILALRLPPSASSQQLIVRNLTSIRADLATLADELDIESSGLSIGKGSGSGSGKGRGGQLEELQARYDQCLEMLGEDEVGSGLAKGLRREQRPPPSPEPSASPSSSRTASPRPQPPPIRVSGIEEASSATPDLRIEPPTPAFEGPFRDYPDDGGVGEGGDERQDGEILGQQQLLMDDQDERLNLLSHSINRQNHLSIQIGEELDVHHDLLEETDQAMDRTASRLNQAKRRLDRVGRDAKQYGSTITIVGLIFVLLVLIIVFKT